MTEHSEDLLTTLLDGPMHYVEFYRRDGVLLIGAGLAEVNHSTGQATLTDKGRAEAQRETKG